MTRVCHRSNMQNYTYYTQRIFPSGSNLIFWRAWKKRCQKYIAKLFEWIIFIVSYTTLVHTKYKCRAKSRAKRNRPCANTTKKIHSLFSPLLKSLVNLSFYFFTEGLCPKFMTASVHVTRRLGVIFLLASKTHILRSPDFPKYSECSLEIRLYQVRIGHSGILFR